MKLVGFAGNDFNIAQLEALGANIQHRGTFAANLVVRPYNAYIQFGSYDENRYRPYLQLDAELCGGRGSFGDGITEFVYREDDRLDRSVRYDFTDRELAILVEKGLYHPEFEVPQLFTDTEFEIPMEMDIVEVELNGNRLVYASYDMISDLETNSEKSGYDLVTYFDQFDYEAHTPTVMNEVENPFVFENELQDDVAVEEQQEQQEEMVEERHAAEPDKVYENEADVVADLVLDEIMADEASEEIKDVVAEIEKTPSVPVITKSGIRNVTDELDAGKANSERMLREALDASEHEHQDLAPDMDDPAF